jgi:Glycosyl hydrolase family 65 central catalytic domain
VAARPRLAGPAGAADFWVSRAERGDDGRYHINQVEGPDEQNWPVDDSVYTNATAKLTLELAARAARLLGLAAPAAGVRSPAAWWCWSPNRSAGCRPCVSSSAPTPASRSSRPTSCC